MDENQKDGGLSEKQTEAQLPAEEPTPDLTAVPPTNEELHKELIALRGFVVKKTQEDQREITKLKAKLEESRKREGKLDADSPEAMARRMVKAFPRYDGLSENSEGVLHELLFRLDEFKGLTQSKDESLKNHLKMQLTDAALDFYREIELTSPDLQWEDAKTALLNHFIPEEYAFLQTQKLIDLKQNSNETVRSFGLRFRRVMQQSRLQGNEIQVALFIRGLPAQLKKAVERNKSARKTLRDAIETATHEENLRKAKGTKSDAVTPNSMQIALQAARGDKKRKRATSRDKLYCTFCHRRRHTEEQCKIRKEKEANFVNASSNNVCTETKFILDSGCTNHLIGSPRGLSSVVEVQNRILVANNKSLLSSQMGNLLVTSSKGLPTTKRLLLENVLVAPQIANNLLSVRQFNRRGYDVSFYANGKTTVRKGDKLIIDQKGSVFDLPTVELTKVFPTALAVTRSAKALETVPYRTLHARFGHPGKRVMHEMLKSINRADKAPKGFVCGECALGKMTRPPARVTTTVHTPLELLHMDLIGPISPPTRNNLQWILTILDDSTKFLHIELLSHKTSESVLRAVREFITFAERAHSTKVVCIRSDQGTEFANKKMSDYLDASGISQQFSNAGMPMQNGNIERVNRTLGEKIRTLMCQTGFPLQMWGDVALTACLLYNHTPHSSIKFRTPADLFLLKNSLRGRVNSLDKLRVIGCEVIAQTPLRHLHMKSKFDAKGAKGYLLGYSAQEPGYRIWFPKEGRVETASGVVFNEDSLFRQSVFFKPENASTRFTVQPGRKGHEAFQLSLDREQGYELEEWATQSIETKDDVDSVGRDDPASYAEAMRGPHSEKWSIAISEEIEMLQKNDTWEVVERPPHRTIVATKWVFRVKRHPDGTLDRFKARLVAKGFSQVPGVDFDATFAPTISRISLRVFLFLAAHLDLLVHQMDAKSAFLQGTLEHEIYVAQPPHRAAPGTTHTSHVCKLRKALYGLRQSPLVWNTLLTSKLVESGYVQLQNEPCLFLRQGGDGLVLLAIYVDDITIAAKTLLGIESAKAMLSSHFEMTDLGEVGTILGLAVEKGASGAEYRVNQDHYVKDLVYKARLEDARSHKTPMELGLSLLSREESEPAAPQTAYRSIVGGLMYAATLTRPDICFATNVVSRFMSDPSLTHLKAAKRVLQYLKTQPKFAITYRQVSSEIAITIYCDADYAGDKSTRKSTSGYIVFANGQPLSWRSVKQNCISTSTVESEYVAACIAAKEGVWIRNLIEEIVRNKCTPHIDLHIDNEGAKMLAATQVIKTLTKHIDVAYHFIRDKVRSGDIKLKSCDTRNNVSDVFTKALSVDVFEGHIRTIKEGPRANQD